MDAVRKYFFLAFKKKSLEWRSLLLHLLNCASCIVNEQHIATSLGGGRGEQYTDPACGIKVAFSHISIQKNKANEVLIYQSNLNLLWG